jgi:hypothetical protein
MATRTRNGLLNVRLSPDSDRREDISAGPSRATSGLMRCSKQDRYSILVGDGEQRRRHIESEHPSGLGVDD